MKHKIIYRILNEDDSCRNYFFECVGDTVKEFKEFYQEQYDYLDKHSMGYLLEHYGYFLTADELKKAV